MNDQIMSYLGDKVGAIGKTLFDGSWSNGASKNVPGLGDYFLYLFYQDTNDPLIAIQYDNGSIRCIGISAGGNGTQYIQFAALAGNGGSYTLYQCGQLTHTLNGNHGGYVSRGVSKIVGLIPMA